MRSMKRHLRPLAALALALLLPALLARPALAGTRLMVVSDIHYLAKPLYEGSGLFIRALRAGDGKLVQRGDALMDALAGEVARLSPDALIVTGDLSFNGERASHQALARRFAAIEADGVPVWVLPGNHDINVPTARRFIGDAWEYTDGATEEDFSAIYADFLLSPGAGANLSYCVPVGDRLRVAMTDVAYYTGEAQTFGVFTQGHAAWLEGVLRDARDAGATAITATHHSLIAHTEFAKESFVMFGSESMARLVRQYGVRLNLSGHLHAQHIAREDGLADAALGAFSVFPHRYALVTLDDSGGLTYEARALDADLMPDGLPGESEAWFTGIAADKVRAALADAGLAEAEVAAMADYVARFNLAYFSGTYRSDDPAWRQDPARALWLEHPDSLIWQYMDQVMNEPAGDNLHWSSDGVEG